MTIKVKTVKNKQKNKKTSEFKQAQITLKSILNLPTGIKSFAKTAQNNFRILLNTAKVNLFKVSTISLINRKPLFSMDFPI